MNKDDLHRSHEEDLAAAQVSGAILGAVGPW